jgi:tol-pal system protein YbgF
MQRLGLILVCLILIPGCYGKRLYELETRMDQAEYDLENLQDSLGVVAGSVAHLDSTVGDKSAPLRTTGARLESRMDDMETRLEMMESLSKETRNRVSQMSMTGSRTGIRDSLEVQADTTSLEPSLAQNIYQNAYVDFAKGDYRSAISGFRDFASRFPTNDFSDDAQFMTGQSFYALGDYANAISEFRKVLDKYPSGDRVPQAMYSLGLSYLKIDDEETAREYFRILAARYPSAPETERAKAMLDSLRTGPR